MASASYARLYRTARWQRLRLVALERDGWECVWCGSLLCGGRVNRNGALRSAVVDHIEPHRGAVGLFFDAANLQSLCKECHDAGKAAVERLGFDPAVDVEGWPVDPAHPAA